MVHSIRGIENLQLTTQVGNFTDQDIDFYLNGTTNNNVKLASSSITDQFGYTGNGLFLYDVSGNIVGYYDRADSTF